MIPSRIVGKARGENWIGLIDATYAIVLTLLVIELPIIILDNLSAGETHHYPPGDLANAIAVIIIGYFAIFTIIYDVWAYHKALLADALKLRMFAITTGWLLFVSSLVSPFYYLVNHYAVELILHIGEDISRERKYLAVARFTVFVLISILYLILAILAIIEKRQLGQSIEKRKELHILCGTALSKSLLTIAVGLIGDVLFISPPFLILTIAISTYVPFNLFDVNPLRRLIQPR